MAKKDPKRGLEEYYRRVKWPTLKGPVSRKPVKPLGLPDRGEFVLRRKGIRIPVEYYQREYLETRAIPLSQVYGSIWERIVYKALIARHIPFTFESAVFGGRQRRGGRVCDFICYLHDPIVVRVMSFAFHLSSEAQRKDKEDKALLEITKDPMTGRFYIVLDLWENVIVDPQRLAEWIDRNLLGIYQGAALRGPRREVLWMPKQEDWDALVATVANQGAWLARIAENVEYIMLAFTTGDVVPEITITAENIEAESVTTDKLDALSVTTEKLDALSVTAGKIRANTITANKFNLALHYVDGTFTDDSPSADYVAWSSCTVTYDGTTHTITNGNTNDPIIWWDLSSPTAFQTAATYPTLDTTDDIIIGWNTLGTFLPLWQTRSVHGENIIADTITASEIAADTITAAEIAASTITATEMNISTLSAIAANMGTLTAGSINMFTGTWDDDATGFRLTADEICGQNAGTDQILIAASTGKLTAGGGALALDVDGITLDEGDAIQSWVKWIDSGGIVRARIYGYGTAEAEDAKLYLIIQTSTGSAAGHIQLDQASSRVILSDLGLEFNDSNTEIWEDASSNLSFKDVNAAPNGLTLLQLLRGFRDDFLGDTLDAKWNTLTSGAGAAVGLVDDDTNRVGGWYRLTTGTDDNGYAQLNFNAVESLNASSGYFIICRFQLSSTSSADFRIEAYDDADNSIWMIYDTDAGHSTWNLQTEEGGSTTTVDTSVAPDTSAHWALLDVSSSAVKLYLDGVLKATSESNIPTTQAQFIIHARTRNTTSKNLDLDFVAIIPK